MNVLAKVSLPARKPKRPLSFMGRVLFVARLLAVLLVAFYTAVSVGGAQLFTQSPNRTASLITPADYKLPYREVSFPAREDRLTIRGWFVPLSSTRVVVVLHGKDSNRAGLLEQSVALAKAGFSLLLLDLRGHGQSDGSNYSYGYYEQRDVLGAVDWLEQNGFQAGHIGLYGASMGASTGLVAMSHDNDIKAMVSDSAFANLGDELDHGYKVITGGKMPDFFLGGMLVAARLLHGIDVNGVRPEEAVRHLNGRHLLLIQGEADGLVPVENSRRLKAAAGPDAELWNVPGRIIFNPFNIKPPNILAA